MASEEFEYNKKLSYVNYSPQQMFSNLHYHTDMDVTYECFDSKIQFFHNIIGIQQKTVELGRIYSSYEISMRYRYLA